MQSRSSHPPTPSDLTHLRPSDAVGSAVILAAAAATSLALALSMRAELWLWLAGQIILAIALVQWFAILHECGHETLFRSRRIHGVIGQVAGFFSIIPFYNWKRVHGRHHKWTGWQDVDPTTATLVPRELKRAERVLVNVCWRFWIPLFSVLYRINNFWNWPRLRSLFEKSEDRQRLAFSSIGLVLVYAAVVAIVGPGALLRLIGLGVLLSLVAEDLLLLSQHTHIPQQLSHGEPVRPFPTIEQEVFTRSLVFPRWLSALLLHIDAHELHHMYPFVPGYRLGGIVYDTENEIGVWTWVRRARAMPGELFLFHNRLETGGRHLMPPTTEALARALFIIVAFVLAGLAHSAWLGSRWSRALLIPLDGGLRVRGRRVFGDNKTVRGFVVMIPAAALAFWALSAVLSTVAPGVASNLWAISSRDYAVLGAWAGLGFMLGELPNSFIKRQLDVAPGQAPRGRTAALLSFVVDRLDSIAGALLAITLVAPTPWLTWVFVILIGPPIHLAFSVLLYKLGVKERAA